MLKRSVLWGEPYYTAGDARRSAHWYYLGSSLALGASGNQHNNFGSRVDVYLVAGKIVGWVDYAPVLKSKIMIGVVINNAAPF